jgi:hypothetical protein
VLNLKDKILLEKLLETVDKVIEKNENSSDTESYFLILGYLIVQLEKKEQEEYWLNLIKLISSKKTKPETRIKL